MKTEREREVEREGGCKRDRHQGELPVSFVSTWPGTKVSQVSFSEDINFEPGASVCACVNTTVRVCVCILHQDRCPTVVARLVLNANIIE